MQQHQVPWKEQLLKILSYTSRVIKSKSQKANQKQSAILTELQQAVTSNMKALEAASAKDAKELNGVCTRKFDNISKQMQEKFDQIEQLNQKYQQVGDDKWLSILSHALAAMHACCSCTSYISSTTFACLQ